MSGGKRSAGKRKRKRDVKSNDEGSGVTKSQERK